MMLENVAETVSGVGVSCSHSKRTSAGTGAILAESRTRRIRRSVEVYSWSGKTKPKYSTAKMFLTITQPARTGSLPGYTD